MESFTRSRLIRHSQECQRKLIFPSTGSNPLPLSEVLSGQQINLLADELGIHYRERVFTPCVTLWTFLTQVLSADCSCRSAVGRLIASLSAQGQRVCSSRTGAYSQARARLPELFFKTLSIQVASKLCADTSDQKAWSFRGRAVKLVDGTLLTVPDTPENRREFPHAPSMKDKPAPGFPMLRILALISFSTGALLDLKMGPYCGKRSGEVSLFYQLLNSTQSLQKGDVLLLDRLFCNYLALATCLSMKIDFVMRNLGARDPSKLRTLKRLGTGDRLVLLQRPGRHHTTSDWSLLEKTSEQIILREITYRIHVRGFRPKVIVLLTSFTDPRIYPRDEIAELYWTRWNCELDLRCIKSVLQMDRLTCKTPEMLRKEIWAHALAYNLIRTVMAQSALLSVEIKPRELSFKGALQLINAFRPYLSEPCSLQDWRRSYQLMLKAIAQQKLVIRPLRIEPRAIKKRKSPYSILNVSRAEARTRYWKKGDGWEKRKADLEKAA